MAGKDTNFGRPIPPPEEIPDHLKNLKKVVRPLFANATIDDFAWLGDDGNLDPHPIVEEMIAPVALLRLVVQAIVGGNPSTNKSAEDRVEIAMRALLGTGGRKGRRHLSSDEPILRRMAVEYLQGFHGFKDPRSSFSDLANWALQSEPGFAEKSDDWKESRQRTIRKKFKKYRDRYLIEVSSNYDWEIQSTFAKVGAALSALSELGIAVKSLSENGTK